jgi:hypothetical protein
MVALGTLISLAGKPRTRLTPDFALCIELRPVNRAYHWVAYPYVHSSVSDLPATIPTHRLHPDTRP